MRIIIAGGTGFLGRPLADSLGREGHDVVVLSRGASAPAPPAWTGAAGVRRVAWSGRAAADGWAPLADGADIIINLAGENIAGRRWTAAHKARLEQTRLETTGALVDAVLASAHPPPVFISASAVGYYGSRGDEVLTEQSAPGTDFLARLAVQWEGAAERAASSRTRVVLLRTGLVLGADGGALGKMLLPFRLGLGGPLGPGTQYMAWIHHDDWMALVRWLFEADVAGACNLVAPTPVTNADFTRTLGAVLGRPAVLPAPAFALTLALGEMAGPLLLASQRVVPRRALDGGFVFRHPELGPALAQILR